MLLAYLSDTSGHRRNFEGGFGRSNFEQFVNLLELNSSYLRKRQILTATDLTGHNRIRTDILLPETQQHGLTEPYLVSQYNSFVTMPRNDGATRTPELLR